MIRQSHAKCIHKFHESIENLRADSLTRGEISPGLLPEGVGGANMSLQSSPRKHSLFP